MRVQSVKSPGDGQCRFAGVGGYLSRGDQMVNTLGFKDEEVVCA